MTPGFTIHQLIGISAQIILIFTAPRFDLAVARWSVRSAAPTAFVTAKHDLRGVMSGLTVGLTGICMYREETSGGENVIVSTVE